MEEKAQLWLKLSLNVLFNLDLLFDIYLTGNYRKYVLNLLTVLIIVNMKGGLN